MRRRARDLAELKAANITPGTTGRIWRFLTPYRPRLLVYLVVILGSAAIGSVPPLLVRDLIDNAIVRHHDVSLVDALAAGLVGLALATTALSLVSRWFGSVIGEGIIYDLRVRLYDHVQRMPVAFFTRTQTGALMSRLTNDVMDAQNAVSTAASVLSDMFILVATLVPMFILSPSITLYALLVLPPFILIDRLMAKRISRLSRHQMQLNADMSVTMTEKFNVAGALLVKLFGRPARESQEFAHRAGAVRDAGIRLALLSRYLFAALSLVGAVGTAAVYWLGGREAALGHLQVGTVVALAAYVTRLYSPLTDLASTRVDVLAAIVSFDRVFEVLDTPPSVADRPGAPPLTDVAGRIEAKHLWFRYPAAADVSVASLERSADTVDEALPTEPGAWVLEDLSFVAEPGTMTALVGPSGAGKTTLSGLIPRLYDVVEGSLEVDGHDVRDVTLQSLSDAIGVVSQDAHLFHDTVRKNLLYANPDATDQELVDACRSARIHDLIMSLPDGYDTIVGERGYRLSGGEKQRLALARVFLKNPAIVILDEATAHLDSETEMLVQQALAEALAGRTSVVIAHRLSTIQAADQILVIDQGRIAARGTHGELISEGGLYAELYRTQYLRGVSAGASAAESFPATA
ncbi:MAG TPA: ABC transporter ATP-binding protein [Acidimicrobiales bacterium]|jgi:ATP-binding cassette subfamily B protein|nr:ABC transporter ATP-binding protein [Acidimicrobiales bacterium]